MNHYCVINNFPQIYVDSVLIFKDGEFVCSYQIEVDSVSLFNLLWEIQHLGYTIISSDQAYELIVKQKEHERTKKMTETVLKTFETIETDQVSLAYRTARNYYFETIRALEDPGACGMELNVRLDRKEGAYAMFCVIRRAYEARSGNIEPDRLFDGAPPELIDAACQQESIVTKFVNGECLESIPQNVEKDLELLDSASPVVGDYVEVLSGRYRGVLGKIVKIFPAGELCEESVCHVECSEGHAGQFKTSELRKESFT